MPRGRWMLLLTGIVLLGTPGRAGAANYRWIDDDGVIHLTNRSPEKPAPVPDPRTPTADAGKPRDVPSRRTESVATEVMRLSGLDAQADLLAMTIRGELERRRRAGYTPAPGTATVVADIFSADGLRENMHQALARSLQADRARTLLAWLRTPLSQRIVSFESAWPTAERQVELTAFVNELTARPPSAARLALIHRLEHAKEVGQGTALVLAAAGTALERSLTSESAGPAAVAPMDEDARFRTMTSLLYTYQELSDVELARYVVFLESPTGRWLTSLTRSAVLASLGPLGDPWRSGPGSTARTRAKSAEPARAAGPRN